jgi:phage terminase small subunit
VLELKGAFKKNPNRRREAEPEAVGELGDPPSDLNLEAVLVWKEIKPLIPAGVATASDAFAFEVFCTLAAQFRSDPKEFPASKLIRLETLWGRFGLDPSQRAKLSVPKGPKKNEFDDF